MPKKKGLSFENKLSRLEEIVTRLEEGPPTLDETLALFEEGVGLARDLQAALEEAETRVRRLARDQEGVLGTDDEDEAI